MRTTTLAFAAMMALGTSTTASAATFVVNSFEDHARAPWPTASCACVSTEGTCTLRAAVQAANLCPGTDTIVLASFDYRLKIQGLGEDLAATGDLDIHEDLEIVGSGSSIVGDVGDRVFHVFTSASGAPVNLTVSGARMYAFFVGVGGVLFVDGGSAKVVNSDFLYGRATIGGGAAVRKGSLTLVDCVFYGSHAERGAAVHAESARLDVIDTSMMRGTALESGGGIHAVDSEVEVSDLWLSESTAPRGGGIYTTGTGTLIVEDSRILDNSATTGGGGLWVETDTTLLDVAITENHAPNAAGVLVRDATLIGSRLDVGANIASSNGGGLYGHRGSHIELDHSTLHENEAYGEGGGIFTSARVELYDVSLWNNAAWSGTDIRGQGSASFVYGNNVSLVSEQWLPIPGPAVDTVLARFRNSLMEHSWDECGPGVYSLGHVASADTDCLAGGAAGNVAAAPGALPLTLGTGGVIVIPASSPAVDAGDDATCESDDQRHVSRPQGAHCDIGAYEYQP